MADQAEPQRQRPAVLDRLAGAGVALAAAVSTITVMVVVTGFYSPGLAFLGGVFMTATMALAIAAPAIATVGLAVSAMIDRLLAGQDLRLITAVYGATGFALGGGIALLLPGFEGFGAVVFPFAGAAAGVTGCLAAYRLSPQGRRRALTAGAVQVGYVLAMFVFVPVLAAISS